MKSMDHQITNWGDEDVTSIWQAEHREQVREPHVSQRRDELKSKKTLFPRQTKVITNLAPFVNNARLLVFARRANKQPGQTNFTYLRLTQCHAVHS